MKLSLSIKQEVINLCCYWGVVSHQKGKKEKSIFTPLTHLVCPFDPLNKLKK
jgi:hypothetical protein